MVVVGCGRLGWGRSGQSYTMPRPVLYLDEQFQLEVLFPNILVGAANVDMGGELSRITLLWLQTIHNLRLVCKAWKLVVDKTIEYNTLYLAKYNYAIRPNYTTMRFMSVENNIVFFSREHEVLHQKPSCRYKNFLEDTLGEVGGFDVAIVG